MAKFALTGNWSLILQQKGIDAASLLKRSQLPADLFVRGGTRLISEEHYFRIWEVLALELEGRPIGLELGSSVCLEALDPAIFAALCSPNFKHASYRLSKYKKLIAPIQLIVKESPAHLELTVMRAGGQKIPQALGITDLVWFVSFARFTTKQEIIPLKVTMPELPKEIKQYEEYFGVALTQAPKFTVTFSAKDAETPALTANAEMWQFFEPVLDKRISEINREATIADRVHATLCELLPGGRSSIHEVSSTLGYSTRSLQRHLKEEGTTFNKVLSTTRNQLAKHYLTNSELTTGEVSFLLGFDEPNSFYRAFRSWTGQTPQQFRDLAKVG